jgi:hypothetical protein
MNRLIKLFLILTFVLPSCATKPRAQDILSVNLSCSDQIQVARKQNIEMQLNSLSVLFGRSCFQEVIDLGSEIRGKNRDKFYSVSKELSEVIVYEGVATEYTLDAHERIFVSALIAMSYIRIGKRVEAEIALNQTYDESTAQIYSSGTDEVNVLFQALLWYSLSGYEKAEPFFRKIQQEPLYSKNLKLFVENNLERLKAKKQKIDIRSIGQMPELSFTWINTYSEKPLNKISVKNCVSQQGLLLETRSWTEKIKRRDGDEKDPVLNYKRAARLPATILYTALVFAAGAGLTIAAANGGSRGAELAAYLAIITAYFTYRTFVNGLSPDMRYWNELPAAFRVSVVPDSISSDPCMQQYKSDTFYDIRPLISL